MGACAGALSFAWACSPLGVQGSASPEGEQTGEETVATWLFHPRRPAPWTAEHRLSQRELLQVDAAGGRWLKRAEERPVAAVMVAPEALVGIREIPEGFAFVGDSGGVYRAEAPLSPFTEILLPEEPFVNTVLLGESLLAVGKNGELFRSEDLGRDWSRVPRAESFVELHTNGGGDVFAWALPETWWRSKDRGATWERLEGSSIAPRSRSLGQRRELVIDGLLGAQKWSSDRFVPAVRATSFVQGELPKFVGATNLARGRAALSGEKIVLLERETDRDAVKLWSGAWDQPLEARTEPLFEVCEQTRLSAGGAFVHVLCQPRGSAGVSPRLELWSSADQGGSFEKRGVLLRGALPSVSLTANERGELALAGVCAPDSAEAGCAPRGVLRLQWREDRLEIVPYFDLKLPVRLQYDRRSGLLALGRRVKEERLTLWRWSPEEPTVRGLDLEREASLPFDRQSAAWSLSVGEAGEISVLVRRVGRWISILLDEELTLLSRAELPVGIESVSSVGARVLALEPRSGVLFESRSGGLELRRSALPRDLCREESRECTVELVCHARGCFVGEDLTRVGFGSGGAGALTRLDLQPESSPARLSRAAGFHCVLGGGSWEDLSDLEAIPGAPHAAWGEIAWTQVASDANRASAQAVHAVRGANRTQRIELLAPVQEPEQYAFTVSPQVEGSAVVRYRLPTRQQTEARIRSVEVAWDNRVSGVVGHGQLPGEFKPAPGDSESRPERTARARPGLLSVAGRGLYFRLHSSSQPAQDTYYFEGAQVRRVSHVSWPESLRPFPQEMVQSAGRDVPLVWVAGGRSVVRAFARDVGDPAFQALSLFPHNGEERGWSGSQGVAYVGDRIGLLSIVLGDEGRFGAAHLVPLGEQRAFDEAIRVPLLLDLPERPRACRERERKETPRVVAPAASGGRHRVEVSLERGELLELETGDAVLHGSVEAPCVAAFEARSQAARSAGGAPHYRALLVFGAGQSNWLFRESFTGLGVHRLEGRPLVCGGAPFDVDAAQDDP